MEPQSPAPGPIVEALLEAAGEYDFAGCDLRFAAAVAELDSLVLVRDVVSPALREAGNRWHRGEWTVVQERMLSGVVRRRLSTALDQHLIRADGPTVLFATLSGERHELGGLMGAVLAASRGFSCIYLGPDLPAAEIGVFCTRRPVGALALSLVTQPDVNDAHGQLLDLRKAVPAGIEIWVAGQAATLVARDPLPAGIVMISDLSAFLDKLALLRTRTV